MGGSFDAIASAPDLTPTDEQRAAYSAATSVDRVIADGIHVVPPGTGWLSCRRSGTGRMAEPAEIVTAIHAVLAGGGRPRGA
jgi:phosphopantothenoylcysteine synthetase/decarboxylase